MLMRSHPSSPLLHVYCLTFMMCVYAAAGLPCPIPIIAAGSGSPPQQQPQQPASGRPGRQQAAIGTLTGHVGDLGMAYIKLQPALAAAQGQAPPMQLDTSQLERQRIEVVPFRPAWWPQEWGREEQVAAGSTNAP